MNFQVHSDVMLLFPLRLIIEETMDYIILNLKKCFIFLFSDYYMVTATVLVVLVLAFGIGTGVSREVFRPCHPALLVTPISSLGSQH